VKENYYITTDGGINRKENTIYFENVQGKIPLPINRIYAIYAYGRLSFSSGAIDYLAKLKIPIHFFNYYGFYEGTFYPREILVSGEVLVKQAENYLDQEMRLGLATKFVEGSTKNILRNLSYYKSSGYLITDQITKIEGILGELTGLSSIPEIMNIEGRIRLQYYSALDEIFPEDFNIIKRERRPPSNKINSLISFGNSLMYSTVLSEIYQTQLNPTISFLHEPSERRFSLALDVSEIFKPIIVDRVIFKLVNKNMLSDNDFRNDLGGILLTDQGKKAVIKEYDAKLSSTIKHRGLNRNVSFRTLIRLELYKLIKHIIGEKEYDPLVLWW
jgi:CRISPR-associated protein Cas1